MFNRIPAGILEDIASDLNVSPTFCYVIVGILVLTFAFAIIGWIVGKGRRRKVTQPKSYKPTVTSLAFNIKGTPSRKGVVTGLGIRPLPKVRFHDDTTTRSQL